MSRWIKVILVAALLFSPVMAKSGPKLDCWLRVANATQPGVNADNPTEEDLLEVHYRNKGDADALNVQVTLSVPPNVTLTSGTTITNLGTVSPSASVSTLDYDFSVGSATPDFAILNWQVDCSYEDAAAVGASDTDAATTTVIPRYQRIYIGQHEGPVDVSPDDSTLVYSDLFSMDLFTYNFETGEYKQLTFDGFADFGGYEPTSNEGCDSHPFYSPDGSMIAWQKKWNGSATTWVMDADGGNQRPVKAEEDVCWKPLGWTADGNHLVLRNCSEEIWITSLDGSSFYQLTPDDYYYRPYAEMQDWLIMVRDNNDYVLSLFDIYGNLINQLSAFDEADQGEFNPKNGTVVFKDDYSGYGTLYTITPSGAGLKCVSCERRVMEYQLSQDASTLVLDYGYIAEIESVTRADIANGVNYWSGAPDPPYDSNTITLPIPLSDNAADRVPVYVTYRYMPDWCSSKPHWNKNGSLIAYKSNAAGYPAIWVMNGDGSRRLQLTFNPGDGNGRSHAMPRIVSNGRALLFSSYAVGTDLVLVKFDVDSYFGAGPEDIRKAGGGGSGPDWGIKCGMTGPGSNNLSILFLLVLPLLLCAGFRALHLVAAKK